MLPPDYWLFTSSVVAVHRALHGVALMTSSTKSENMDTDLETTLAIEETPVHHCIGLPDELLYHFLSGPTGVHRATNLAG